MTQEVMDAYNVLGVSDNASDEELKNKYRELSKKYHPDYYAQKSKKEQEQAKEIQQRINAAYSTITEYRKIKLFDNFSHYFGLNFDCGKNSKKNIQQYINLFNNLKYINDVSAKFNSQKRQEYINKQNGMKKGSNYEANQDRLRIDLQNIIDGFHELVRAGLDLSDVRVVDFLILKKTKLNPNLNPGLSIKKVFLNCINDYRVYNEMIIRRIPNGFSEINVNLLDKDTFLICNGSDNKWNSFDEVIKFVNFDLIEQFYDTLLKIMFIENRYNVKNNYDDSIDVYVDLLSSVRRFFDIQGSIGKK